MTVSTLTNSVVYRGNGATTQFAVPYKVLDEDHLRVRRRVFATRVYEHTYIGTDYTYTGIGADSGTLTLLGAALDDDYELVIERLVPYTQDLDIVNAGGFYPETVEEQLDLITMGIQQIADLASRGVTVPIGEAGMDLGAAADRAGKYFGFDAEGDFAALTGIGADSALRTDLAALTGAALVGWKRNLTNAVARSLSSVAGDHAVSVKDFGAVGDGVTDDYAAIAEAITRTYAANRELYFPYGIYNHSQPLEIAKPGFRVRFEGYTRLRYTGGGAHCVRIGNTVSSTDYDFVMRGPVIIESTTTTAGQIGLLINNFARFRLEDVIAHNVSGTAFRVKGAVRGTFINCRTTAEIASARVPERDWHITGSDDGVPISRTTNCIFIGCDGRTGTLYGLDTTYTGAVQGGMDSCVWLGGAFEGLPATAWLLTARCSDNIADAVFCESNGTADFDIAGTNNTFRRCSAYNPNPAIPSYRVRSGAISNRISEFRGDTVNIFVDAGALNTLILDGECRLVTDAGTGTILQRVRQLFLSSSRYGSLNLGNVANPDTKQLDWYEEGAFTPTFGGTTTDGDVTEDVQVGRFTRIGNRVYFNLHVRIGSVPSNPTGNLAIRGLPYASKNDTDHALTVGLANRVDLPGTPIGIMARIPAGQSHILLTALQDAADAQVVPAAGLVAQEAVIISGHYEVA